MTNPLISRQNVEELWVNVGSRWGSKFGAYSQSVDPSTLALAERIPGSDESAAPRFHSGK